MNPKNGLFMITFEQIKELYSNQDLKNFLINSDFSKSLDKKMIGITLDEANNFILKFYVELKEDSNLNKINRFTTYFKKFKSKIDFRTPTSFATGFKIKSNNEWVDYVHFKFGKNIKLLPKSSKLKFIGTSDCNFGLSIEQNNNEKILKRYFYYFTKKDKELIKSLFSLNVDIDEVYHFEVYETHDNVKVNIIYDFFKDKIDFLKENNLDYFSSNVEVFNKFFEKKPKYFGLDKNKNLSFYYSFSNEVL